jgi:hypothetical protein
MVEAEIARELANHEQRLVGAEHRIKDLEETQKEIRTLTISVEKLALSVEHMVEEQRKQSEDIEALKSKPAKSWNTLTEKALTTAVGTVVGAVVTVIAVLLTNYF